jgi:long-subunit acyl-CoA synthetase (AMP-forming)
VATLLQSRLDAWERHLASGEPPGARAALALALLEAAEAAAAGRPRPAASWHRFLDLTRRPAFLVALGTHEARRRWAEVAFAAIRTSRYTLATLLAQRVAEHPERPLFQESPDAGSPCWSYEAVASRLARTAAALLRGARRPPRVLILSPNSVEAACADLACLVHGIPVTPLNPETDRDGLVFVLERLRFGLVLVHGDAERTRVERALGAARPRLLQLDPSAPLRGAAEASLAQLSASLTPAQVTRALEAHVPPGLDEPATVMFTSGSSGLPKGVVHTGHAILAKRFARAAALPEVGTDETLLCYLPLFHTFGRYLELLGSLFWGGSYVFAGNPSFETLARALPQVRPTGLVGVPRRWLQLRERCLERERGGSDALRAVVGDRLRWGLSAAGHLEPAVFRFFQRHGVELCSGFGMTEAAGGVTMTPPGAYEDDSVGVPLPGLRARLGQDGELEIAGPYVGRYLDDPPPRPGEERWLATGDVFTRRPSGHFEIVDRLKDVYKNTRGQTVAPAAVERRLADVPGVRRALLVGDGRDENVLLIVPDRQDAVIAGARPEAVDSYFDRIVAAVNGEVAPHERVVRYALLARDFEPERELTPKGSYRRREIERAFAPVISELYRSGTVELRCGPLRVRLPRWFVRDLGLLETDLVPHAAGVLERRSGRVLAVAPADEGRVRVGDLEYEIEGQVVDLGLFARQPLLWAGNPALRAFAPCKDGWDVPLARVAARVRAAAASPGTRPVSPASGELPLEEAHALAARALFARVDDALAAVSAIAERLPTVEPRIGGLLRRRLSSLAWHPDLAVRCLAYRTLLLDEQLPGSEELLASFVQSGHPFLDADSIDEIARARPERHRLESLRLRLRDYRRQLAWPAVPRVRAVFEDVFDLLARSARERPEQLVPVRAELAAWALFDADAGLASRARAQLGELAGWCCARLASRSGPVALHGPISDEEVADLERVLSDESFLSQSVALAFDEPDARAVEVGEGGAWVAPLASTHGHRLYRVSFDGRDGKQRDLLLALRGDVRAAAVEETMLWMIALGDRPGAPGVVPRFGCARADLGALSTAYVSGLSLWERVRAWAGPQEAGLAPTPLAWRSLFVRGLSVFFGAWQASEGRILPGQVVPTNVDVPRADYPQDARILSLAGWRPYQGPRSLVEPMQRYFLDQAAGHYPALRGKLDPEWVYEAAVEGLGLAPAREFLAALAGEAGEPPGGAQRLRRFRDRLDSEYRQPLALQCAVARYVAWQRSSPKATAGARRQLVRQLLDLYGLEAHGEIARYQLYRRTYFAGAPEAVAAPFDRLLRRLFERPGEAATRLVELSELQSALAAGEDRRAFGELVFPRSGSLQDAQLLSRPGAARVLVRSQVADGRGRRYAVREPAGPAEVGRLYRLLSDSGLAVGSGSRQLVLLDGEERVVGGISWRAATPRVAHLEGIVVAPGLRSQRLAGALLEDFCARLASAGCLAVHTQFGPEPLPFAPGFRVHRRWGGLVRFLQPDAEAAGPG